MAAEGEQPPAAALAPAAPTFNFGVSALAPPPAPTASAPASSTGFAFGLPQASSAAAGGAPFSFGPQPPASGTAAAAEAPRPAMAGAAPLALSFQTVASSAAAVATEAPAPVSAATAAATAPAATAPAASGWGASFLQVCVLVRVEQHLQQLWQKQVSFISPQPACGAWLRRPVRPFNAVPAALIHCTHILQANQAAASQATEAAAKEADAGAGAGGPASSAATGGALFAFGLPAAAGGQAAAPAFSFGASAAPAAVPAAPSAAPGAPAPASAAATAPAASGWGASFLQVCGCVGWSRFETLCTWVPCTAAGQAAPSGASFPWPCLHVLAIHSSHSISFRSCCSPLNILPFLLLPSTAPTYCRPTRQRQARPPRLPPRRRTPALALAGLPVALPPEGPPSPLVCLLLPLAAAAQPRHRLFCLVQVLPLLLLLLLRTPRLRHFRRFLSKRRRLRWLLRSTLGVRRRRSLLLSRPPLSASLPR